MLNKADELSVLFIVFQVQDHGEVETQEAEGATTKGRSFLGLCTHYPLEVEMTVVLGALFIVTMSIVLGVTFIMCLKRRYTQKRDMKRAAKIRRLLAEHQPAQCHEPEVSPKPQAPAPVRGALYDTARPQDLFLDHMPQVVPQIIFPVSYSMGMGQTFTGMQNPMYRQRGFIESGSSTLRRVGRYQNLEGALEGAYEEIRAAQPRETEVEVELNPMA